MKEIPVRKIKQNSTSNPLLSNFNSWKVSDLLAQQELNEPLHRHNFYFLLALENGSGNHEIDFVTHEISDNMVFLVRPGQVHKLHLHQKSTGFLLQFDEELFTKYATDFAIQIQTIFYQNVFSLTKAEYFTFNQNLECMHQEQNMKESNYSNVISAHLDILMMLLNRKLEKKTAQPENSFSEQKLIEFKSLLDTHISTVKRVEGYAELLNLTNYQLNSITKKLLDKTPSDMINQQLILEARRQLLATTNQVSQIAFDLGYEDVSYFIRFFKKQTGTTPDAYRKNFV